jgi:hypothetical protein
MMESIVQRQRNVLVIGNIWPSTELPPTTQQDDHSGQVGAGASAQPHAAFG